MSKRLPKALIRISKKGFTLIELLVVIGILGILAVAILAAINPIEQLNKAQDTNLKNAATTYVSAVTQYYSVHNTVPFGTTGCPAAASPVLLSSLTGCTNTLVTENELKDSFKNTANLNSIYITNTLVGTTYTTYACFQPTSKAVQADTNTKYTRAGAATCTGAGCYWCAQ